MAAAAEGSEILAHFRVENYVDLSLFGVDLSISNSVVWMWLATLTAFAFFMLAFRRPRIVPGRFQALAEMGHGFILALVNENIRPEGRRYFPVLFALFFFILFCNLAGLIPGAFTPTSQIAVTAALAISIFILTIVIGIVEEGWGFFREFAPPSVPKLMLPLMVPIEIISHFARPVSLSVRLFANMTAGHTMLAVLALLGLGSAMPLIVSIVPFGVSVALMGMELFIAFIQAFIFTILTCVYINDALGGA